MFKSRLLLCEKVVVEMKLNHEEADHLRKLVVADMKVFVNVLVWGANEAGFLSSQEAVSRGYSGAEEEFERLASSATPEIREAYKEYLRKSLVQGSGEIGDYTQDIIM